MDERLADESNATPAEIAEYYDTWAGTGYDEDIIAWGYDAPLRAAAMVATHLEQQPGPVLDAGCGTGQVGAALYEAGVRDLVGGDFTPVSVQAARQREVYNSVDHMDLNERLAFDDDQFAAVVSTGVFSYLADTSATIAEMLRVTKPGGAVIFSQRTDLWEERDCDAIIDSFVAAGTCTATMSEPQPYLPDHPEFADKICIIYTTLIAK